MGYIRVTLLSDLCVSSGNSFGNLVDSDYCTDSKGLPIIPGRRLKGCLRQAADLLVTTGLISDDERKALFGDSLDHKGCLSVSDARIEGYREIDSWLGSPLLPASLKTELQPGNISGMFSTVRGQTRMKDGVADKGSLRYTRVLSRYNPITGKSMVMTAEAALLPDSHLSEEELCEALQKCCRATRHMGLNRNRGLGFVRLDYIGENNETDRGSVFGETKAGDAVPAPVNELSETLPGEKCMLRYRVLLDLNLIMNGISEQLSFIPGRSVIGCLAQAYINKIRNEESLRSEDLDSVLAEDSVFRKLFLTGDVSWSDLTPVIGNVRSEPTPLSFLYLKNRGSFLNQLYESVPPDEKTKTLEGTWAAKTENGYLVASAQSENVYHHRHEKAQEQDAMLYTHTSLIRNALYEGRVTLPQEMLPVVTALLSTADLRFGHSKNAQYSKCCLKGISRISECREEVVLQKGEPVFVVLTSDMNLTVNGRYVSDAGEAREVLSREIGLENRIPEKQMDHLQFALIGGYHAKWHMQKMQLPVIRGGSVFCFEAKENGVLPAEWQLGEWQQEGLGLCCIFTVSEMKKLSPVKKSSVSSGTEAAKTETDFQKQFHRALLAYAVERRTGENAEKLFDSINMNRTVMNNLNNGRIRLMVEEAAGFSDLMMRINAIKQEKAKNAAVGFIEKVFPVSEQYLDDEHIDEKLKCIITDGDLAEEICSLAAADKQKIWNQNWKKILLAVLSMHEYRKKGDVHA